MAVTQKRAEKALAQVAEWMGKKGYGTPICPDGIDFDPRHFAMHVDGTDCTNIKFGPAPTGDQAARNGEGPMLNMTWDWPNQPTPTIILEGGPEDWAVEVAQHVNVPGVFAEPWSGWALCLHPA